MAWHRTRPHLGRAKTMPRAGGSPFVGCASGRLEGDLASRGVGARESSPAIRSSRDRWAWLFARGPARTGSRRPISILRRSLARTPSDGLEGGERLVIRVRQRV